MGALFTARRLMSLLPNNVVLRHRAADVVEMFARAEKLRRAAVAASAENVGVYVGSGDAVDTIEVCHVLGDRASALEEQAIDTLRREIESLPLHARSAVLMLAAGLACEVPDGLPGLVNL